MKLNQTPKDLLIRNLRDAGCDDDTIIKYLNHYKNGNITNQIFILKKQRCLLLEQLHIIQKEIDCLDYLLYNIKKEMERK